MRASRTVPAGYGPAGSVVLNGNLRLKRWLNAASVPALLLAWYLLVLLAAIQRPELAEYSRTFEDAAEALLFVASVIAALLAAAVAVIVVHESIHGVCFWFYTRSRPRFGFKGWYAYASAPGWYLPRNTFLVVGLSPLVVMTATALGLAMVLPPAFAVVVLFGAALNTAASLGDVYICARLLSAPASAWVEDYPDGITWHVAAA